MIKSVLSLVVLLHLCYSVKVDLNLSKEIIKRLDELNNLYKQKKLNIPHPQDLCALPTNGSCVGLFISDLRGLLRNVTVHESSTHILSELEENLTALQPSQERDCQCRQTPLTNSLKPFKRYTTFLKRLNSRKK